MFERWSGRKTRLTNRGLAERPPLTPLTWAAAKARSETAWERRLTFLPRCCADRRQERKLRSVRIPNQELWVTGRSVLSTGSGEVVAPEGRMTRSGMDPRQHRLDDELQRKARSVMGFSSRTKARAVRTPEYP